ncbi:TPA: hypothetical protein N2D99_002125 [Clostridium botulinum]|nr:hypothetical protein [Clostridium botulinum]
MLELDIAIGLISSVAVGFGVNCFFNTKKRTGNKDTDTIQTIEEKLEAKTKLIGLKNKFVLSYSETASACRQLPRFEPGQFNHIKVIQFYEKLIGHMDKSNYDKLIVELFEYHLNEQLLVIKDDIISLDEQLVNEKSNEEKEYLLQRASKHSDLMDKIAKDIEENKSVFARKYSQ